METREKEERQKMKYPKLPKNLDRRIKLTEAQKSKMKLLRRGGMSFGKIAKEFECHKSTVRYWIDEDYKERKIRKDTDRLRNKILTDPEFKAKQYAQHYASIKYRRKVFKPYAIYRYERTKEFQDRHKVAC